MKQTRFSGTTDLKEGPLKKLPQYVAVTSACLTGLTTGTVLGWTGNISEDLKNSKFNGIEISDGNLGWLGAMIPIATAVGSIPIGKLCDVIGRRAVLLLLAVPLIVGWCLMIFANSLVMLYVGRFITSCAAAGACGVAIAYISEVAEKNIRGAAITFFIVVQSTGTSLANVLAAVVDIKTYTIILATLPLLYLIAMLFQPESPVYIMKCGNEKRARAILERLRGSHHYVNLEIADIKIALEERSKKTSLGATLKNKAIQKALLVGVSLVFFKRSVGSDAVLFYTETIFSSVGFVLSQKVSTIIIGAIHISGVILSMSVIEKLGRRTTLLCSTISVTISMITLGIFFSLKQRELVSLQTVDTLSFLPIASLSVYTLMFNLGLGPVSWMMIGELFPPEAKGVGSGVSLTFGAVISFVISKYYLDLNNAVGGDITFFIFAVFGVLATMFTLFVLPETKGKSLGEIQREANDKK